MKLLLENWRAYLDEVEDFDAISSSQDEIQQSLDYFYHEHAPSKGKRKDLGDWRGSQMVSFELPNGDLFFFVVNEQDKPLMYLAVAPFRESYAVGNVRKTKATVFMHQICMNGLLKSLEVFIATKLKQKTVK